MTHTAVGLAHHISPEQLRSPEQALKTDTAFFDVKKSTHAVVLSDHAQFEEEGNMALEAATEELKYHTTGEEEEDAGEAYFPQILKYTE